MAPCAKTFKADAAASLGSKVVFHDNVDPAFFTGTVPDRATTMVVSAQKVSKPFLEAWRGTCPHEEKLTLVRTHYPNTNDDPPAARSRQG